MSIVVRRLGWCIPAGLLFEPNDIMGLTLHYELRLPASTSSDDVAQVLDALRAHAVTLPVENVGPVMGPSCHSDAVSSAWLEFSASIVAHPFDEDVPLTGDVATAQGFRVDPGDGCETATFGFLSRADAVGGHREWFWCCSCKTQYASVVSDQHFVGCHTAVVSLLERAIELGVAVVVHDETHYWETRDEKRLIEEVQAMNRLIAGFAGQLPDALGPAHDVQASIFEHPRFERLEMGE